MLKSLECRTIWLNKNADSTIGSNARRSAQKGIKMKTKTIRIQLESGLEARPVALMVQEASKYDSRIYVEAEGKKVNAKSIMGMMTLGLDNGEELVVTADGEDENLAVENLERFLSGN